MVIVTSSHHLLFLGSLIAFYNQRLSSQLHRVLRLLEYQFRYFFISSFIVFYVYDYFYCWRFIIASRRNRLLVHRNVVKRHQHQALFIPTADPLSIDNHLLEGTWFREAWFSSSEEGSTWPRLR